MSNSFYAERYLATIEILKKHGLWNLELGLLFMPVIQHCMPPPSIHKIHQLLIDLTICEVDTDWAPYKALLKLKKEVARHIHAPDLTSDEEEKNWGKEYAIAFGIHRISQQTDENGIDKTPWPNKLRARVITEFVEIIYERLSPESIINKSALYADIYQLRDTLIVLHANENNISTSKIFTDNIVDKKQRVSGFTSLHRNIGSLKVLNDATFSFWDNPPISQFCVQKEDFEAPLKLTPKKIGPEDRIPLGHRDEEYMRNNIQQRLNIFSERPLWVRDNVRSLADANQLSWGSIFQYWEFLLTKKFTNLFKMSLICFITGIHKKRWINGLDSNLPTLDSVHLDEHGNKLIYKLNAGATDFLGISDQFKTMELFLPSELNLTEQIIESGLKEESTVRAFNRIHPGPSPILNNIARSGHTLLRKNFKGETLAFIMSGTVPIEFKARSAYLATDSDVIHDLFNNCLSGLKKEIQKRAKRYPQVSQAIKGIKERENAPITHYIGSQLATPTWNFSALQFHTIKHKTIESCVEQANQMVLYFYWMTQYSLATRPPGERTESSNIGDFCLHKDKDSDRYFESKVLLVPDLLKKQKQEVYACIANLQSFAQRKGFNVGSIDFDQQQLCYYKVTRKKVKPIPILSREAIKLTKNLWGLAPSLDRPNAYRHQCATYIHKQLSENHADVWLGHHIDGWCYSAPESSANHQILKDVLKIQENWLEELGFHLVKNPLS